MLGMLRGSVKNRESSQNVHYLALNNLDGEGAVHDNFLLGEGCGVQNQGCAVGKETPERDSEERGQMWVQSNLTRHFATCRACIVANRSHSNDNSAHLDSQRL
eukprot:GHVT01059347.1.p1 GENE.GHVT01059347.1~~GHVT01059347.1.p1  ORF type:complete len:103 (-),score=1.59 GHVT01059347.1:34-342(-)